MQNRVMNIVLENDDVSWQSILFDLVRKEGMNPFDVNITKITQKYIDTIRELKEHDFRLSGKVVLAAALLLKLKSSHLVGKDLTELDRLLSEPDFDEEGFFDDIESGPRRLKDKQDVPSLLPRTPQPRKRKVSIHDLVWALQKALEVKRRRVMRNMPAPGVEIPKRKFDIAVFVRSVFSNIVSIFKKNDAITFSNLTSGKDKDERIMTFLSLLELTHKQRIDMHQEEHFGDIGVELLDESPLPEEEKVEPVTKPI